MASGAHPRQVTVVFGKQRHVVDVELGVDALQKLQKSVEQVTGVASQFQKLLFRGRELHNASQLEQLPSANAKVMLLLNQQFHQQAASNKRNTLMSSEASSSSSSSSSGLPPAAALADPDATKSVRELLEQTVPADEAKTKPLVTPVKRVLHAIDPDQMNQGEDCLLVVVSRGNDQFQFVFDLAQPARVTVQTLKQKLQPLTGIDWHVIRLVIKGKTPSDEQPLRELITASSQKPKSSSAASTGCRTLKCMMLLKEAQHDLMDMASELCCLQNEITSLQLQKRKLHTQMARNLAPKEETHLQCSQLHDQLDNCCSNLQILLDKRQSRATAQAQRVGQAVQTLLQEAKELLEEVEEMTR